MTETSHEPAADAVLIIDDDTQLCGLVEEYLTGEGFRTGMVHDGSEGAVAALSGEYQLVILDVMLPGLNGFEVLRKIRSQSDLPVIMLTARGEEIDRIVGLEIGADDYLPKPFNPRELTARIRAVLRRARSSPVSDGREILEVDDTRLSLASRNVTRGDQKVTLTAVEFDLLARFLSRVGEVQSREVLTETILGRPFRGYDRSIDVHVSHLRQKMGPHPDGAERIRSVRSVGYLYTRPESSAEESDS